MGDMMTLIDKYLAKEVFKYFNMLLLMVVSIYLLVDFFEKIDNFMEAGLPISKILSFFQLKIPLIVTQITPIGILLAVIIVFGLMNKNNELIALQSSGVSIYFLLRPVIFIGLTLSILVFLLSDLIVPITVSKANKIWNVEVKKRSAVISKGKNIWIKDKGAIYNITYFNPAKRTISGIAFNYFDDDFRLTRRIDARRGIFKNGRWIFYGVMEQKLNKESNNYQFSFFKKREESFHFLPEEIKRVVKKSEEMNFLELFEYIRNIESEGYDASTYKVDLYAKLAFPFICLIMCLVGPFIAGRREVKEGLSVSIFYGICIAFFYWVFYSFCLSLGHGEILPPFLAAWTANIVFFSLGIFAIMK
ncbi:MAG: LPS export ABC transporter permease LptG [Desulfobacterales bacterium]|nr:MAG: LPS export ABC transporter permease LptG [Desulfobacterales bacterium]